MKAHLPPTPVLLLALLIPLLSLIPTWQGYHFQQPPEKVFMGFRYMAGDHYQYAALMRQAQFEGRMLMENRYTTEPQKGVYVFLYYWLIGTVARLTGASLVAVWEYFRVLGGFMYILAFWRLTAHFFNEERQRLTATVLFAFGGGLDWIVTALRVLGISAITPLEYPFDYYWNWSTFGTMLVPNWIWPAMLLTVCCLVMLSRSRWRDIVIFILPPVIWLMHHHTALVVYLTLGCFPIMPIIVAMTRLQPIPWRRVRANLKIALPGLISFVVVIGYLRWASSDLVFRLNAEASFAWKVFFSVWWYPLSYGILLPLVWFGIKNLSHEEDPRRDLVFSWLMAAFFLSVNPIEGGAKYQYLMFLPIALLAARGLYHLKRHVDAARRLLMSRPAMAAWGLLLFLDAPVSLIKDFPAARSDPEIYATAGEISAMQWLAQQPDGSVLSSYRTGHMIPWLAGKKVYIGHWFMTLNLNQKAAEVNYFFAPQASLAIKREIMRRAGARYVFLGPSELSMGDIDPGLSLKKVYDKDGVRIFEVPQSS